MMQFKSFHWLTHHGLRAIIPCSKRKLTIKTELKHFRRGYSLSIFWGVLMKQLFQPRLLDMNKGG